MLTLRILFVFLTLQLGGCAPDLLPLVFDAGPTPSDTAADAVIAADAAVDQGLTDALRDASAPPVDAPVGPRTTFPLLRVFVAPAWSLEQRVQIQGAFAMLRPVLPDVEEAEMASADVGLYPTRTEDCAVTAGGHFSRTAYVTPACFPTREGFTLPQAVAHVLLDYLGLSHVCVSPGEARDCSPVPLGAALMNAHFAEPTTPQRVFTGWRGGLSAFDMAEARRVIALVPR